VSKLHLAFYGDDFTGSTDALEFLTRAGLRTVLFTSPPSRAQLAPFGALDAIGVAGLTRSLAPRAMERELRRGFAALRRLRPRHVHYKVCSTFDSSPQIGSIGRAIEVGADMFRARFVPLVVGAPPLGRWCVFGNLFARLGIGSRGQIFRLDRHPAMSGHAVTPMDESDLRRHLAKQTRKRIGLVDVLALNAAEAETAAALEQEIAGGADVVLFDVLTMPHLARIGGLLEREARQKAPLFSVGSSAIEVALGTVGAASRRESSAAAIHRGVKPLLQLAGAASPLLVVSGSCSPVTAAQIAWAEANGFAIVPLNNRAERAASAALATGRHTVICSSRGSRGRAPIPAAELGATLGALGRSLVGRHGLRRLLVAGGDTSSYAARALGIVALEMIAPLAPGAPLCRAHAPGSPLDGGEVNFKGGQVGREDYFGAVAAGHL
jgi:3-oxoisoapionate kinase